MQLAGLSGPLNCAAPELAAAVVGLGPPVAAGRAVDMWGLGILLYEMLTGMRPHRCSLALSCSLARLVGPRML